MAELEKSAKEYTAYIKALKQEIEDLLKKKADIVKDINKPVLEAKTKADKILAEAEARAQNILAAANERQAKADEIYGKRKADAQANIDSAAKKLEEVRIAREGLERDTTDFKAEKYTFETNLQQQKAKADQTMSSALKLQEDLSNFQTRLNTHESLLNKRESSMQEDLDKLNALKEETKKKIEELRVGEKASADEKIEIMALKASNEEVLKSIQLERNNLAAEILASKKELEETKALKEKVEQERAYAARELNYLAKRKDELDEQEKSLHEKQRLQALTIRQIDEKIATLNKLRSEPCPKCGQKQQE